MKSAAIIGSGSFGTAVAQLLGANLARVVVIGRDAEVANAINTTNRNSHYLRDVHLHPSIEGSTAITDALVHPLIVFAVPTAATRSIAQQLAELGLPKETILLSCAKGIEQDTGTRMSQILQETFPHNPVAVLSGPNHAEEMATGMATCAVVGSKDDTISKQLQELFTLPHFRTYTSDDIAGIELGGAVKNVYAIAAGIAHGLKLGDNAVAALVTRALAEMTRFGVALGGRMETFAGLSGVGDLIVTCFSQHSRNHRVGLALGEGKTLEEAVAALGMVAEGVPNTKSIYTLAHRIGVRTPIIDAVYDILYTGKPALKAMHELLGRDPRAESE